MTWDVGPVPTGIMRCVAGRNWPHIITENALKLYVPLGELANQSAQASKADPKVEDDWNGDGAFNGSDFVAALGSGGFENLS